MCTNGLKFKIFFDLFCILKVLVKGKVEKNHKKPYYIYLKYLANERKKMLE